MRVHGLLAAALPGTWPHFKQLLKRQEHDALRAHYACIIVRRAIVGHAGGVQLQAIPMQAHRGKKRLLGSNRNGMRRGKAWDSANSRHGMMGKEGGIAPKFLHHLRFISSVKRNIQGVIYKGSSGDNQGLQGCKDRPNCFCPLLLPVQSACVASAERFRKAEQEKRDVNARARNGGGQMLAGKWGHARGLRLQLGA